MVIVKQGAVHSLHLATYLMLPPCRGPGLPSCRLQRQPPPDNSRNSHPEGSLCARSGPASLEGTCNTSKMNADYRGAGNRPMGPEKHQVTWHLIVRISRVKAGQPHLTMSVVSVEWMWTRNKSLFTCEDVIVSLSEKRIIIRFMILEVKFIKIS